MTNSINKFFTEREDPVFDARIVHSLNFHFAALWGEGVCLKGTGLIIRSLQYIALVQALLQC